MIRTENPFIGFPSATETTGVITAREIATDLEDGVHTRDYVYTSKGTEHRRNHKNSNRGIIDVGSSKGNGSSSSSSSN